MLPNLMARLETSSSLHLIISGIIEIIIFYIIDTTKHGVGEEGKRRRRRRHMVLRLPSRRADTLYFEILIFIDQTQECLLTSIMTLLLFCTRTNPLQSSLGEETVLYFFE